MLGFTNGGQKKSTPPPVQLPATITISIKTNQGTAEDRELLGQNIKVFFLTGTGHSELKTWSGSSIAVKADAGSTVEVEFPDFQPSKYGAVIPGQTVGTRKIRFTNLKASNIYSASCTYSTQKIWISAIFQGTMDTSKKKKYWFNGSAYDFKIPTVSGERTYVNQYVPYEKSWAIQVDGDETYWVRKGGTGDPISGKANTPENSKDSLFWVFESKAAPKPPEPTGPTYKNLTLIDPNTGSFVDSSSASLADFTISAKSNTANCYVIHTAGKYSMPLVPGTFIKNGKVSPTVTINDSNPRQFSFVDGLDKEINESYTYLSDDTRSVSVENYDISNVVSGFALHTGPSNIPGTSTKAKWVTFTVGSIPANGTNIIIAAKTSSGKIIWTWHLWLYPPTLPFLNVPAAPGHAGPHKMMSINLGAIHTSSDPHSNWSSPLYQFGRITPLFCDTVGFDSSIQKSNIPAMSIGEGIANPTVMYGNIKKNATTNESAQGTFGSWFWLQMMDGAGHPTIATPKSDHATFYKGVWSIRSGVKSLYDPSPIGWRIPSNAHFSNYSNSGSTTFMFEPVWNRQERPMVVLGGSVLYEGDYETGSRLFFPRFGHYNGNQASNTTYPTGASPYVTPATNSNALERNTCGWWTTEGKILDNTDSPTSNTTHDFIATSNGGMFGCAWIYDVSHENEDWTDASANCSIKYFAPSCAFHIRCVNE